MINALREPLTDIWVLTGRNLIRYKRIPQLIAFSSIQPIMFLLLFNYVFGGAIAGDSSAYISFLIPGLIAQTVFFGTSQTSVGLAQDMTAGIVTRFKSLPINSAAVMLGRSFADSLRNLLVITIMISVGYLLGFRIETDVLQLLGAVGLALLFGFAFSWVMITIGLLVKDPESTNTASFLILFPFTFASTVFVPLATLPSWLQVFVRNQPVTHMVDALRALLVTGEGYDAVWKTIIWMVIIIAIFIPLAVSRFRKATV